MCVRVYCIKAARFLDHIRVHRWNHFVEAVTYLQTTKSQKMFKSIRGNPRGFLRRLLSRGMHDSCSREKALSFSLALTLSIFESSQCGDIDIVLRGTWGKDSTESWLPSWKKRIERQLGFSRGNSKTARIFLVHEKFFQDMLTFDRSLM